MITKLASNWASGPSDAVAITRPADLKRWIDALPYVNLGAVLGNLNDELAQLNTATVKASVRFELLELHAGAYVRLLDSLGQAQGSRGVSALEQHRAFAESARRLTLRMADGYKLVVDGTPVKKSSLFANRHADTVAIQRAVLFFCYSLNHYYDQYLPTEARVWIELATLNRLANERGSLDRAVPRGKLRLEFGKPISHLYKLALLTGLADPYRQGPGEVWRMFEFLGECADVAVLGTKRPSSGFKGIFVIDPVGIERARPLEADLEMATGCYLNSKPTIELLQKMCDWAEQAGQDVFPTARSKRQYVSILNRVLNSLNEPAHRSNDRKPLAKPVYLASGITATQCLIDGTAAAGNEAVFSAGPDANDKDHEAESKKERDSSLKMIDPRSGATVDIGVAAKAREAAARADALEASTLASYGTEPWQVTNKSRVGIGIMRRDPPRTPMCVGEVIALAGKGRASAFGLVRWLTVDEVGVYRAGAEIIGTRAECVSLRRSGDEESLGAERRALALPYFGAAEKVATLIAPPGTFSERGELIVENTANKAQARIAMTSLIDATPSCERFSYRII